MTEKPTDIDANKHARIRELNDNFRMHGHGKGNVLITSGIQALGHSFMSAVITAVQNFDDFTNDNDPWEEHDFGAIDIAGQKIFWKFDYYDTQYTHASPDASDESVTRRVLTVMLAEEY